MLWCVGLAFAGGWRVVDTPHFRLYYPIEAEEFGLHAASQLESIRDRVADEVGFAPHYKTQIVVRDPYGESNGLALPMGRAPRVELWATPPSADSSLGHYHDWAVDLILHEDVHVVHLLKPPRGLSGQLLYALFGTAPIAAKSPRWLTEGYATLAEGSLTGAGRPNGDFRATLLRELAVAGDLPSYAELGVARRWQGSNFPYTVGSAFLEWLELQEEGGLDKLWRRLTARQVRNFEDAFRGVYGDRPARLYRRFTAELTGAAMVAEQPEPTSLWLNTQGDLGRPALSPDGQHLAVVQHDHGGPSLVIWKTETDEKAQKRRADRIKKMLVRDPEDAAPIEPRTPPHAHEATWVNKTHRPHEPRWLDDETVLFTATVADKGQRIGRDVYRWTLGASPKRLTHGANIHRIDAKAGRIVGLTSSWGRTGLVEVHDRGNITTLIEPSAIRVLDQPRLSPDGTQIAFLENRGEGFRLKVLGPQGVRAIEVPPDWQVRQIAWGAQGIVASVGVGGRLDLVRFNEGGPVRLTQSGASMAPEPGAEHLYHLEMHSRGYQIHRIPTDAPGLPIDATDIGLAGRPPPPRVEPFALSISEGRRIGLGRLEPRILVGGTIGARESNFEIGLRLGDVIGRNEFAILGSLGVWTGAGTWWENRTLPFDLTLRSWALRNAEGDVSLGGSGIATLGTHTSWNASELVVGGWGETGQAAGHAELSWAWVEPQARLMKGHFVVKGAAGVDGDGSNALTEVGGQLTIGGAWYLETTANVGLATGQPYSLGGVRSAVRAPAAQWNELQVGWLVAGSQLGSRHDRVRGALGLQGISAFVERRRIHDGSAVHPYTLVGLEVIQASKRQPLVRVPGLDVRMGVGCAFERDGLVPRACRKLEDYRAWSSLTWIP